MLVTLGVADVIVVVAEKLPVAVDDDEPVRYVLVSDVDTVDCVKLPLMIVVESAAEPRSWVS